MDSTLINDYSSTTACCKDKLLYVERDAQYERRNLDDQSSRSSLRLYPERKGLYPARLGVVTWMNI